MVMETTIFNIYSKEYDLWYEKHKYVYLSELAALKKVVPVKKNGLEIGVGTGIFAQSLGIKTGIDPSQKMLKIAQTRGIQTYLGVGENLPFGNQEFGFVLITITLCFVNNPEKVVSECKRVLKKNGKIIIGIIDKNSYLGKIYQNKKTQGHRFYKAARFFSVSEIIELLENHNFTNITSYQTLFQPAETLNHIEKPKKGYGEGSFVVISGTSQETSVF